MSTANDTALTPEEPLFQVLAGNPTDEELAVLAAVVVGLSAGSGGSDAHAASDPASTRRAWTRRRQLALRPAPGPGSWRRSYR
ncbi:acyl-CoA carboxylase subunit epsilon [Arthrobacter sp. Sa2BUA2]|uniref:Acyl-CoA carboxylase subunit epsilon n=1 Tax=Arthrobacter pullicola TaxID=2762224 RepID=A0ABR8YFP2_9MICC|nr:acyl-CoA carboxylase subunit epsilon [Arthrobacter pullicola]MBD8043042.1 acyl-CoA carboxylase subunit epsilon [Arthrobacter pullicola]